MARTEETARRAIEALQGCVAPGALWVVWGDGPAPVTVPARADMVTEQVVHVLDPQWSTLADRWAVIVDEAGLADIARAARPVRGYATYHGRYGLADIVVSPETARARLGPEEGAPPIEETLAAAEAVEHDTTVADLAPRDTAPDEDTPQFREP